MALFDPRAPERILAAAEDELDWGIAWCCVREGMHPHNLVRLRPKNLDEREGWLQWVRAKNQAPRRTLVPVADRERLASFLRLLAKDPPSVKTVWARARLMVARAGFEGGPRVLRKTFILNELRRLLPGGRPDVMDLVAMRAGCKRETVAQYYLDLNQWEEAYGRQGRR